MAASLFCRRKEMNIFSPNSSFARGINKLVMMLYVGILWFLCSIPIITMGASTAALYEVLLKAVKNQESYVTSSFFKALKENMKRGIAVWLPLLIAFILFAGNLFYYGVIGGRTYWVQIIIFTILLCAVLAVISYVFPVMARFENTASGHIKMATVLAVRNPGWTVVLLVLQVFTWFLVWFFVWFPALFIMGIMGYVQAVIFNHIFDRMIGDGSIRETGESGHE